MNKLKLKCVECGGVLEIDSDRKILSCPYCGSKQLIIDSDDVRIQEIKSDKIKSVTKSFENVLLAKEKNKEKEIDFRTKQLENNNDDIPPLYYMIFVFIIGIVLLLIYKTI